MVLIYLGDFTIVSMLTTRIKVALVSHAHQEANQLVGGLVTFCLISKRFTYESIKGTLTRCIDSNQM